MAASELAATVSDNLYILQESPLLKDAEVEAILPHFKKLHDLLQPVSKDSAEAVTKKSINKLVREVLTNDNTAKFTDRAFTVGAALFTTSIPFMTMRELFHNIAEFAVK